MDELERHSLVSFCFESVFRVIFPDVRSLSLCAQMRSDVRRRWRLCFLALCISMGCQGQQREASAAPHQRTPGLPFPQGCASALRLMHLQRIALLFFVVLLLCASLFFFFHLYFPRLLRGVVAWNVVRIFSFLVFLWSRPVLPIRWPRVHVCARVVLEPLPISTCVPPPLPSLPTSTQ